MNELSRTEKWLERAFQLAYFIHGDVEIAKQIAFNAMNKLEVASNAQYKRYYYTPEARNSRNKVSMKDLQLLQRLVYVESETFEKEKEFTETATEKDLLIYFVKHLIRITLKRNSFYVTLGLSRILHNYGTNEAMEIYNVVVQDPERVHDDYYYRSRKGVLMKELKNRFGAKLEIAQVNRGEQRFQTAGYSEYEAELVKKCLNSFVPWNTNFEFPEKFNPQFETIKSLSFEGKNADDEHRVELNRMHVLLNPETFQKVVNALSFPLPDEKLEIPKFNMKKKTDSNEDENGKNPPSLGDDELKKMAKMLEQEAARRKAASCGYFRVLVDGEEVALFDSLKQTSHNFEFDKEFAELIEVYSVENGRDTLLTTYLMGGEDEFAPTSMLLENGQKISFSFNDSVCEVGYQETRISRRLACWWRKTSANFGSGLNIARPAMAALGLLLAVFVGLTIYFNLNTQTPQVAVKEKEAATPKVAENNQNLNPIEETTSVKETINPEIAKVRETSNQRATTQKRPLINQEIVKPIEVKKVETKPLAPKKSANIIQPEENLEIAEVKKFPIIERREDAIESNTTRSINESGKSLKSIKYIYVEVSGDEKYGRQIGEQLMDKFNANKRFLAVNNKDKADGLLKVSVRREHDNGKDENTVVTATVRLVNTDGFVVYPSKKKVSAWRYVGNATKIPVQVVKDLAGSLK
ncbi:MAG: hypothetical protein AAB336_06460 [Acidobacteriota bacterium]